MTGFCKIRFNTINLDVYFQETGLMNLIKNKIVFALLLIAAVAYCYIETAGKGDFFIFLSAADDLSARANIYEKTYVDGYHYFYSVFFALLLKPFVDMPFAAVKLAWLLINLFLAAHLFVLLAKSSFIKTLSEKQKRIFLFCIFLFAARFIKDNIHTSQITIVILWCCIYGLYLIFRKKTLWGALILALGINIKLLPIVFLPYLIYRGYFKAFIFTVGFYFLFLFIPSVFIGHDYNMNLLSTWLHLINPTNQNHVLDVEERSFHGLSTLLSTLLVKNVPDVYAMDLKRNIADVSLPALSTVLTISRLILVFFTLYFTGIKFFKKTQNLWQRCVEVSYILMIIPLIFPHQQGYAFLFVIPAVCCILYFLFTAPWLSFRSKQITLSLLVICFLSFSLKFLLGEFNNYYDHFKILTYGALLLIPILAWVWMRSKKENIIV